jgi:hypothetical protein
MDIFRIERRTHFSIGAAPRELSGQSPEIDAIFAVEGFDPETVLLVVMISAEANAEDVVRLLVHAGVGR